MYYMSTGGLLMPLEDLGRLILEKRNKLGLGIRGAAREVGISHATLARVEKGFLPDLENYEKIRQWLGNAEPDLRAKSRKLNAPQVHFRREKTATPETAAALARMILAAQAAWSKGSK
jgi:transcriptional regulator with XRE-family HTH domain